MPTAAEMRANIERQRAQMAEDEKSGDTLDYPENRALDEETEEIEEEETQSEEDDKPLLSDEEIDEIANDDILLRSSLSRQPEAQTETGKETEIERQAKFAVFAQNLHNTILEDMGNLADKYGSNWTLKFGNDIRKGKVKFSDHDIKDPNILESKFLSWVNTQTKHMRASDLRKIIEAASGEEPLRTKSLDLAVPARLPKGKPEYIPKQSKGYVVPDFSTEEIQEALMDYLKKHPEKLNRR